MGNVTPASSVPSGATVRTGAERNFRWNSAWFVVDYLTFGVGLAFLNQSTVLPTFVSHLTSSAFLIGLVATIQNGAWLLPQLVAAGLVAGKSRKRLYMVVPAALGRPAYLLLGLFILTAGDRDPTLLLVALYTAMVVFGVADSFCSVPWFDILGKAIPATHRGRLLGTAQVVTGLAGVAVGGAVSYVLAHPGLTFPSNYGVLFLAAAASYMLGVIALYLIREPVREGGEARKTIGQFLAMVGPVLRSNPRFARVVATRLCFGAGAMVFPFYIVYAQRVLGFGPEHVGLFLSAQVLGGVVGGLLLGQVADRRGIQVAIRVAIVAAALAPGLGLATTFLRLAPGVGLFYLTATIFVAIGVTFSSYLLGFINYVLEIAPADDRATYAGLFNTINGSLLVVPAVAGWFLEATSFPALFAVALVLMAGAATISLGLPPPQTKS